MLADAIVVSESRFFREAGAFAALRERILPELVRRREQTGRPRELDIWSAGCSTGEEAYTLAMIALETVPLPSLWTLRVLGTDLSGRNIAQAREGVYDPRRLEALPPTWSHRYVTPAPGDERVQVGAAVRKVVTFRQHNLCGDLWTIEPQDVIVCQNVLIYFRREDQLRVLNRLYDTLRPGGYLLVGATELPIVPIRRGSPRCGSAMRWPIDAPERRPGDRSGPARGAAGAASAAGAAAMWPPRGGNHVGYWRCRRARSADREFRRGSEAVLRRHPARGERHLRDAPRRAGDHRRAGEPGHDHRLGQRARSPRRAPVRRAGATDRRGVPGRRARRRARRVARPDADDGRPPRGAARRPARPATTEAASGSTTSTGCWSRSSRQSSRPSRHRPRHSTSRSTTSSSPCSRSPARRARQG